MDSSSSLKGGYKVEEVQKLMECYKELKNVYNRLRGYLKREKEVLKTGDFDRLEEMIPERADYFLQMASLKEEIESLRAVVRNIPLEDGTRAELNLAVEEAQGSFEEALTGNLENINLLEEKKNRLRAQLYVLPRQKAAVKLYEKTYTRERW